MRGRDLASAVAEAQGRTRPVIDAPYRAEWSGEFQQMEEAVRRLTITVTLALIVMLGGMERCVQPLTMIPLTAILGMLPAALATKIGSETQRPLAIVIVGGMTMTLVLLNLLPVLYAIYGDREPPHLTVQSVDH